MPTTLTSREFNQDHGRAKRAANQSPVIITDRGEPAHVLMSFAEYQRLTTKQTKPKSIVEALAMPPGGEDIDFESVLPRWREFPPAAPFDFD
ncbi:type II toxin-antitoxin system Phd/YefM family antitoxin [Ottowia testudinis]|uniref:Antitoxin n=1 Tax=Ottowia testudinis TaxID=2816950 RepID=A0A975CF69_9BURK|nr:type II toxin-antitoxin system Phd/YefM family antitoxin [Ottowia testudinis]QTD44661.1 type II toxin-antitoxin system Phd/YefM family antitoxin [Ottowia testudinis]